MLDSETALSVIFSLEVSIYWCCISDIETHVFSPPQYNGLSLLGVLPICKSNTSANFLYSHPSLITIIMIYYFLAKIQLFCYKREKYRKKRLTDG